jgi:hypothetical protein
MLNSVYRASGWPEPQLGLGFSGWLGTKNGPKGRAWASGQARRTVQARPGRPVGLVVPCLFGPCQARARAVPGRAARLLINTDHYSFFSLLWKQSHAGKGRSGQHRVRPPRTATATDRAMRISSSQNHTYGRKSRLASFSWRGVLLDWTARASPSTFVTSGRADLELVRTAGWSRRLRTDLASLIFVFNFSSTYTHTKGCLLLQLSQKSVMIIQNLHNNSVAIM